MLPTKIITVIIDSHGEDMVVPNYIVPKDVRILSSAGAPGCYNFQNEYEKNVIKKLTTDPSIDTKEISTYRILNNIRELFMEIETNRSYANLNETFESIASSRNRYIPGSGTGYSLATKRTQGAIYGQKRFRFIKSTTEHKYAFTPKDETIVFPDGIYVIGTTNNIDSGLKFGDNLAERRYDINEESIRFVPVSSINDIKNEHINYTRRKFGPYLGLASLYLAVANISPFNTIEEVSTWFDTYYNPTNNPVDVIYKFGCMKLFQTGKDLNELKALMCATLLGEKYVKNHIKRVGEGKELPIEKEVFVSILNSFNRLTTKQTPDFFSSTGLSQEEFDRLLKAYNVSFKPAVENKEEKSWEEDRDELIQTFNSVSVSNPMLPVPPSEGINSENIKEITISKLIKYFKGLGYDGINIIDISCRVNTNISEAQMQLDEEYEKLPMDDRTTNWGGNRKKKTQKKSKKRKGRKTPLSRRNL
jgi:hypothetical protein